MKAYFNYWMQAKTVTGEALAKIAALANIREIHRQQFYSEMHFVWARAQYEFILYSNARRIVKQKSPLLKAAQALREAKNAVANLNPEERGQFLRGLQYVTKCIQSETAENYMGVLDEALDEAEGGMDLISILEEGLSYAVGRGPLQRVRKAGRGRNFSTIENWPLDHLVRDLLYQADLFGDGLKYNKNDGGRSLLDALDLLFPLLPDGFVPEGDWPLDAINNAYLRHRAKRKNILAKKALNQRLNELVAKKRARSSLYTG
jgi:hypothetical protein